MPTNIAELFQTNGSFNPTDKADATVVNAHIANTSNPHSVTKAQVGLTNVVDINTAVQVIEYQLIGSVTNATYRMFAAGYAFTLNAVIGAVSTSGSCILNFYKNGVLITGLDAISVTSTDLGADDTATANNTFVKGDILSVVVSSASSLTDLFLRVQLTRT